MRRAVVPAALVAALGASGCGGADALPLSGETAAGVPYRLEAGAPSAGDDAAPSWCLALRYAGGAVIDGDELSAGIRTCGEAPAPRVSGMIQVACPQEAVFVFGGATEAVEKVQLVPDHGAPVRARWGRLPPDSGFAGQSFLIVGELGDLPADVREATGDGPPLARIPGKGELCEPIPGAPDGPQSSMSFPD